MPERSPKSLFGTTPKQHISRFSATAKNTSVISNHDCHSPGSLAMVKSHSRRSIYKGEGGGVCARRSKRELRQRKPWTIQGRRHPRANVAHTVGATFQGLSSSFRSAVTLQHRGSRGCPKTSGGCCCLYGRRLYYDTEAAVGRLRAGGILGLSSTIRKEEEGRRRKVGVKEGRMRRVREKIRPPPH